VRARGSRKEASHGDRDGWRPCAWTAADRLSFRPVRTAGSDQTGAIGSGRLIRGVSLLVGDRQMSRFPYAPIPSTIEDEERRSHAIHQALERAWWFSHCGGFRAAPGFAPAGAR
jgi:hypothetical protein